MHILIDRQFLNNNSEEIMKRGVVYSTFIVSTFTIIIKFLGLIKQSVLASVCGATIETDAFFVATGTMTSLSGTVFSAVSISLLTLYTEKLVTEGRYKANQLINTVLRVFIPISLAFSAFFALFASTIAKILAPSYIGIQLENLSCDIRMMSVEFLLSCYYLIINVVLETEKCFLPGKAKGFFQNLFLILASLVFYPKYGIRALLWAFLIAGIAQCALVTWSSRRVFSFTFSKIESYDSVKQLLKLTIPLLLGNAMYEINQIVDNQISTGLGQGNASVLNYGASIHDMVVGVIVTSISVVLFSHCSTWIAEGKIGEVNEIIKKTIQYLTIILLPIMAMCLIAGDQIVEIFYGRGNFGTYEINQTYAVVIGYSVGFVFQASRANLVKIFYAFKDSKTPMINGMISIVCNIILSFLLSRIIGIGGVALATSISMLIATLLLLRNIKKYLPNFTMKECIPEVYKGLAATLVSAIPVVLLKGSIDMDPFLSVVIEGIVIVGVYIIALIILNSKSIKNIASSIRRYISP